MKLLLLTFSILVIKVLADDCGGEKYKKIDGTGVVMVCRKGVWKVSQRLSKPTGPPCTDDASLSANGTCAADRGHCQQYTDAGADMDRVCPETCESCDACRCQDANQWHTYCPFWAQYCGSSGVLGNWMTSNCRKTCGKCRCKCCSYGGKQHQLGARIRLPEKCGELVCEEGLVADYSPLLKGATGHKVSHPEELTLNFWSIHDGADCCILPGRARNADGSSFPNGTMVPEGWSGNLATRQGSVSAICCHGVLSVPLEEVKPPIPTTPGIVHINATLPQCKIESLSFALDISGSMGGGSMSIWKPVAVGLVEEMARRQVNIDRHYLFTYVDTIQGSLTTQNTQEFKDKIDNWSSFSGSRELTFAALKHAMEQVNSNAFVCVWTDEIGDDTNDATLKSQILTLKASTNSEIFFMVLTPKINGITPNISGRKAREDTEEAKDDDDNSKKRASVTLANFEQKFNDIGHVLDITNDPNAINKIINIMVQTAICNQETTLPSA